MKENNLLIENDKNDNSQEHDPIKESLLDISKNDITFNKRPGCCTTLFDVIFPCLRKVNTQTRRLVVFRNPNENVTNWSNKEENHKYSILFFIPVVLFNQFKQFGNFFYLLLSVSQFFPDLKVGFLFTYLSPLGIVIGFSMLKELYDDIKRRIQDKKTNSTLVTTLKLSDEIQKNLIKIDKKAAELNIGDIIELKKK